MSITINNIIYNYSGTTATVTGYDYVIKSLRINSLTILNTITINNSNYSVTKIGFAAFYYGDTIKSITIPDSVIFIDDKAFENCTSL